MMQERHQLSCNHGHKSISQVKLQNICQSWENVVLFIILIKIERDKCLNGQQSKSLDVSGED